MFTNPRSIRFSNYFRINYLDFNVKIIRKILCCIVWMKTIRNFQNIVCRKQFSAYELLQVEKCTLCILLNTGLYLTDMGALCWGVKCPGCNTDHLPLSDIKVKNAIPSHLTSLWCGVKLIKHRPKCTLTFTFYCWWMKVMEVYLWKMGETSNYHVLPVVPPA
jgi:hypothetical protein